MRLERALDGVGHRVGQMDPVGVGPLGPAALDPDRVTGVADHGRVRRDVVDDDACWRRSWPRGRSVIGPSSLAPEPMVTLSSTVGMPLAGGKAGAAERDALVEGHVVADLRRLADHHAHPVVDEEAVADPRRGMDLDPGQRPGHGRDQPRQPRARRRHAGHGRHDERAARARPARWPAPRREPTPRAAGSRLRAAATSRRISAAVRPISAEPGHAVKRSDGLVRPNELVGLGREERRRYVALTGVGQDRGDPRAAGLGSGGDLERRPHRRPAGHPGQHALAASQRAGPSRSRPHRRRQ